MIASAIIERAELPVQRNSTLNGLSITRSPKAPWTSPDRSDHDLSPPTAAMGHERQIRPLVAVPLANPINVGSDARSDAIPHKKLSHSPGSSAIYSKVLDDARN